MSRAFFLPHDKTDGPGLQEGDLNNSQMGVILKSLLFHCVLCEISQKSM